ncbi:MAG: DUF1987 domain-containing protein [Bacteroidales bacterium]|jgi:hypothetical protein|nr:DUF1987 domain-containing protein [Bacteroidales bacterium]
MSTIKMKMDEYSPQVSFDKHSSRLNISGRSVQENPEPWYAELLEKILEEISNNNISSIRFLLDYFNTASAKQLYRLLQNILKSSNSMEIIWAYEPDDEDMKEAGEDFQGMLEATFQFEEAK